jgi:hypothetical protein
MSGETGNDCGTSGVIFISGWHRCPDGKKHCMIVNRQSSIDSPPKSDYISRRG